MLERSLSKLAAAVHPPTGSEEVSGVQQALPGRRSEAARRLTAQRSHCGRSQAEGSLASPVPPHLEPVCHYVGTGCLPSLRSLAASAREGEASSEHGLTLDATAGRCCSGQSHPDSHHHCHASVEAGLHNVPDARCKPKLTRPALSLQLMILLVIALVGVSGYAVAVSYGPKLWSEDAGTVAFAAGSLSVFTVLVS